MQPDAAEGNRRDGQGAAVNPFLGLFLLLLCLISFVVIRSLRMQIGTLERELKDARQDVLSLQAENRTLFKAMLERKP